MKIERDLISSCPDADWARFPHLLIWHGRRVCLARVRAARSACSTTSARSSRVWTPTEALRSIAPRVRGLDRARRRPRRPRAHRPCRGCVSELAWRRPETRSRAASTTAGSPTSTPRDLLVDRDERAVNSHYRGPAANPAIAGALQRLRHRRRHGRPARPGSARRLAAVEYVTCSWARTTSARRARPR